MIKKRTTDILISLLFFISLILLNYGVTNFFNLYFGKEMILAYTVFIFIEIIRLTLFYSQERQLIKIDFIQTFIMFTTIQLLACLGFVVFIKLKYAELTKPILMQFMVLFLVNLVYQVIMLLRQNKRVSG